MAPVDITRFRAEGYVVVPGAVGGERLAAMQRELAARVEQSREPAGNYGETLEDRHRFDLEVGHTWEAPRHIK